MNQALSSLSGTTSAGHGVSLREAFWVWARVAVLSFGGPAGQIAVMHKILVEEKRWVSDNRFLHALNYCMLLPGPEAQQLATYVGWLMHRTVGGIMAGGLFIVPVGWRSALFVDKVRDIVGLYLSPPTRALVLSVDEKSQIQALDREQPLRRCRRRRGS